MRIIVSLLAVILASVASDSASFSTSAIDFNANCNDHQNLNSEWVKITNSGSTSISLNGWTFSDEGVKHTYKFPMFSLDPSQSVIVYTGCG